MSGERTGRCLCGAISYRIAAAGETFGACHCDFCLHWTGGPMMSLTVQPKDLTIAGEAHMARYRSSAHAERCFCRVCGASLFYHITAASGDLANTWHVTIGTLDSRDGLTLAREIFADRTRGAYALAGATRKTNAAEAIAFFSAMDEARGRRQED